MRLERARSLSWFSALCLALLLGACGDTGLNTDPEGRAPAPALPEAAGDWALHLKGSFQGAAWGLGPQVRFEGWIRFDRWLRADLRFHDDKGRPGHETLVWGPGSALLFDHRKGRFMELGDEPGEVEFERGRFQVRHVLWLMLGRWIGEGAPEGKVEKDHWAARDGEVGLRGRFSRGKAVETALVWRGERLSARLGGWKEGAWGPIPREMVFSGSMLETEVRGSWTVDVVPTFDDGILDPLRPVESGNPAGR